MPQVSYVPRGINVALRNVDCEDLYILPVDDFPGEVLIPCLSSATGYECMAGFFDSGSLRTLAPGLAEYIYRPGTKVRLIMSPHLSDEDRQALERGLTTAADVLEQRLEDLVGEAGLSESALARFTLDALSYLLAVGRLEVQVALVKNGLFHMKVWIFSDEANWIVCDGSANLTRPALRNNVEQVRVSRSWDGEAAFKTGEKLRKTFDRIWCGGWPDIITLPLPKAVELKLLRRAPTEAPTPAKYFEALRRDLEANQGRPVQADYFHIPPQLEYQSGPYSHQGRAVDAWEGAGCRGILAMATGSGKTKTALIAAQRTWEQDGALLVVVAVPYRPLLGQWAKDAKEFGIRPALPGPASGQGKLAVTEEAVRRLRARVATVECLIVTHDFLCDRDFQFLAEGYPGPKLLVADEVHNLGRRQFAANPPQFFQYRLGLSATPERQYDPEGTDAVVEYFGDVVFRFTLEEAIGLCLVPYDYFVHPTHLREEEVDRWEELTVKLRRMGWGFPSREGSDDPKLSALLSQRRAILEGAGAKIGALAKALGRDSAPHHTLIYATDKAPGQLKDVNGLLRRLRVPFHQVTAAESADGALTSRLLEGFRVGDLRVLTAKRVLDEGVDIPEVTTAYILGSTTVERQWVQRRGRVLRLCPAVGKTSATIHDFLVVPPDGHPGEDPSLRGIVRGELNRIMEFARLARNAAKPNGALIAMRPYFEHYL